MAQGEVAVCKVSSSHCRLPVRTWSQCKFTEPIAENFFFYFYFFKILAHIYVVVVVVYNISNGTN